MVTAVMKNIKVVVNGKWIRKKAKKAGSLWPGKTRWVKVPVKLTKKAKRKRATVVKARVSAFKVKAKVGKKRVRAK